MARLSKCLAARTRVRGHGESNGTARGRRLSKFLGNNFAMLDHVTELLHATMTELAGNMSREPEDVDPLKDKPETASQALVVGEGGKSPGKKSSISCQSSGSMSPCEALLKRRISRGVLKRTWSPQRC